MRESLSSDLSANFVAKLGVVPEPNFFILLARPPQQACLFNPVFFNFFVIIKQKIMLASRKGSNYKL